MLAFFERRAQLWTRDWVETEARKRGKTPEQALLAIFDLFEEWFQRDDFEGCSFINVLVAMTPSHSAGEASARHLENIRGLVRTLAEEARLRDPESFALSWHILMRGSIVQAQEGEAGAAKRAQALAKLLIEQHRAVQSQRRSKTAA